MRNNSAPVIVIKRGKKDKGKEHSSAWKIAFADFTLSMMAVFLVLWVISMSTSDDKQEIAKYFNDPGGYYDSKGYQSIIDFGGGINDNSMLPDMGNIMATPEWRLYLDMEESEFAASMAEFKNHITLSKIGIGVRVSITEDQERVMFTPGSKHLTPFFEDLLLALAPYLKKTARPIYITGHSDGLPYTSENKADNWELSSQRANEARKTLVYGGFPASKVLRISAKADTDLLYPDNPADPRNRRIEIVVLGDAGEDYEDGYVEQKLPMQSIGGNQALRRAFSNKLR